MLTISSKEIFLYLMIFCLITFWTNFVAIPSEQDKGLESLSEIIGRQKQMASGISTEIDLQNGK